MPIPAGPSGLPIWAPTLPDVADHVPGRTLVPVGGANVDRRTFDSTTNPPAEVVSRLIVGAVAWVLLAANPIDPSLDDAAATCAALYAAGCVERSYPERQHPNRDDAITTAKDLFVQATAYRTDLAKANEQLTGTNPEESAIFEIVPPYSFPAGVPYAYGYLNF